MIPIQPLRGCFASIRLATPFSFTYSLKPEFAGCRRNLCVAFCC
jgi:hypothetical protein